MSAWRLAAISDEASSGERERSGEPTDERGGVSSDPPAADARAASTRFTISLLDDEIEDLRVVKKPERTIVSMN